MFQKVLIANRGEIAVRVIRACREMGVKTVAVYSEADTDSLHVHLADEAVCIGPAPSSESYLNGARIISAALATRANAVHPGFGFLSEKSKFAEQCLSSRLTFIGPPAEVINKMGNKSEARRTMKNAGVPVIPGTDEAVSDAADGKKIADEIGYPVMIKAAFGGGGKGMRLCDSPDAFIHLFQVAQRESINAFSADSMYIEKCIIKPRHIELQILADRFGNTIQLGERDCSIQRRHQKMIEEAPSSVVDPQLRERMGNIAVLAAQAVNYENAGTIEFLLDKDGSFYFMEMNTRIQVEHPVTELITGVDMVREQICIAAGYPLSFKQSDVNIRGHAIECRINAEDPKKKFMPCPGKVSYIHIPGGNGVRVDTAVFSGYAIPPFYDSMIMKAVAYARDRNAAIDKIRSVMGELIIEGVTTNVDFLFEIINSEGFRKGDFNTHFIQDFMGTE